MTMFESTPAASVSSPASLPRWLTVLLAVTLFLMASQLRLPLFGGRIALADLGVAISLAGILIHMWKTGKRIVYKVPLFLALLLYAFSAIFGRAGLPGAVETVQRIEQLFCGYLVIAFLLEYRRSLLIWTFVAALGVNLLLAAIQAGVYGFGSVLAPADVLALPWGIGGAYTALFRSRMAFSFFLGAMVLWLFPMVCARLQGRKFTIPLGLGLALVLSFAAHGGLLALLGLLLFFSALLQSRRAVFIVSVALLALAVSFSGARKEVLLSTLSPFKEGEGVIKTCHTDLVAAMRMAAVRPLRGIGPGRYQEFIGSFYGELPNPNYNDIDADTQSGLGILLSTAGYPAGLALVIVMLMALAAGLRSYLGSGEKSPDPLVLGGAMSLVFLLAGMLLSDPLTRGLAWVLCLALASCWAGKQGMVLDWRRLVAVGMVLGVLSVLAVVLPKGDPMAHRGSPRTERPPKVESPALPPADTGTASPSPAIPTDVSDVDIFRIIDAGDALEITAPALKTTDSQAAKQTIIHIPDGKGKPPEGQSPDLKYGGARFSIEMPCAGECRIWVRVWWEGSCGNTICVKTSQDAQPVTVGNDGTYNAWHWLEVPGKHALVAGTNEILLLNREDGVRFDQMLITNDMEYYPQGIEEE